MKNYEKYKNEIKNYKDDAFCNGFIKPHILEKDNCNGVGCIKCCMLQMMWLLEEYEEPEEPETDWSKVEVDTPILVKDGGVEWVKRHFAKYENGLVYAWKDSRTSWTGADEIKWKYAKLAEVGEEYEEPEVDWSKVEVDTPILVRNSEDKMWRKRHFAKHKNGNVYAWSDGQTSWTAYDMMVWKYAKLPESEEDKK